MSGLVSTKTNKIDSSAEENVVELSLWHRILVVVSLASVLVVLVT